MYSEQICDYPGNIVNQNMKFKVVVAANWIKARNHVWEKERIGPCNINSKINEFFYYVY